MAITNVFVYGTLKKGCARDLYEFSDKRISAVPATIKGTMYTLAGFFESFPAVKLGDKNLVCGELHTFPEKAMESVIGLMDELEGYSEGWPNNLYNRKAVTATVEGGEKTEAYVYEYSGELSADDIVEGGVWETPQWVGGFSFTVQ